MDMWVVVKFLSEDTVDAVPSSWLKENSSECFWPPKVLKHKIKDLIKNLKEPEEYWNTFSVKVLGFYDSYEVAKQKATKATNTSDLSSLDDTKRTKKRTVRYASSSDLTSDDAYTNIREKRATKMKKICFPKLPHKQKEGIKISGTGSDESTGHFSQPSRDMPFPSPSTSKNLHTSRVPHATPRSSQVTHTSQTPRSSQVTHTSQTSCTLEDTIECTCSNAEFQKQVMSKLSIISAKLSSQKETLDNVERILGEKGNTKEPALDNFNAILELFPIDADSTLEKMETFLKENETNCSYLAKELSRIGGDHPNTLTKKIMYRSFTNNLGQYFSWDGAKGKRPFKTLLFSQVIIKAVRCNIRTQNACEDEIIKAVKAWLLRCKSRNGNKNTPEPENKIRPDAAEEQELSE